MGTRRRLPDASHSDPPYTTKLMTESQKCGYIKENGNRCGAWALRGSDPPRCYHHSEETAAAAAAARRRGGKNRAAPAPAEPVDLSTPEAQRRVIEETIDRVRAGLEPINLGRFVIYAVATVRSIYDEEIEERLARLEEQLLEERSEETN